MYRELGLDRREMYFGWVSLKITFWILYYVLVLSNFSDSLTYEFCISPWIAMLCCQIPRCYNQLAQRALMSYHHFMSVSFSAHHLNPLNLSHSDICSEGSTASFTWMLWGWGAISARGLQAWLPLLWGVFLSALPSIGVCNTFPLPPKVTSVIPGC